MVDRPALRAAEGEGEGVAEAEGEGQPPSPYHSADTNQDGAISLSELLRVIQFFNSGAYHVQPGTEDGYGVGAGDQNGPHHSSDYNPADWSIQLTELLRLIQFFNSPGGAYAVDATTEDGFRPGA
jgi:hypothetical protein